MKRVSLFLLALAACLADDTGKLFDQQLTSVQKEFVPLVEAMPPDQLNFAPTEGEFKGARTFRLQAMHVAAVLYIVSAGILGDKLAVDVGANENGPATITAKSDVMKYVSDAFAYAHTAMNSLSSQNLTGKVKSPFGGGEITRGALAIINVSHVFDHYGQMVIYARMKGVIPPASRR